MGIVLNSILLTLYFKYTMKFYLNIVIVTIFSLLSISCDKSQINTKDDLAEDNPVVTNKPIFDKVESILHQSPDGDYIMVLAHRGGFISTPENSLSAIKNSAELGVDIVEIDVRLSKDSVLVIMHDQSLDRTTNGTGLVIDYTLKELKEFILLMPNGTLSNENIPSLQEALEYSKGKMHLFIDKGDDYLDLIYTDMVTTNTVDQTIIGGTLSWYEYNLRFSDISDKINYIPRAGTGQSLDYVNDFEDGINPLGYFPSCDLISSNNQVFNRIKEFNKWIFSTTLKGSNCSEETLNEESIWDWEISRGIDGIFTDKSKELIEYLSNKGLHTNE